MLQGPLSAGVTCVYHYASHTDEKMCYMQDKNH